MHRWSAPPSVKAWNSRRWTVVSRLVWKQRSSSHSVWNGLNSACVLFLQRDEEREEDGEKIHALPRTAGNPLISEKYWLIDMCWIRVSHDSWKIRVWFIICVSVGSRGSRRHWTVSLNRRRRRGNGSPNRKWGRETIRPTGSGHHSLRTRSYEREKPLYHRDANGRAGTSAIRTDERQTRGRTAAISRRTRRWTHDLSTDSESVRAYHVWDFNDIKKGIFRHTVSYFHCCLRVNLLHNRNHDNYNNYVL